MTNPLINAYRKPNLYINLPSNGKFYKEKPHMSIDNELAVYSMTARDELIAKNPDALFNGEATYALLKSCCPDIPDPYEVPSCDLAVLMIAIRKASYGDDIDMDLTCPSCKHFNQMKISATSLLGTVKENTYSTSVKLENNFSVTVRPYNVRDRGLLQIEQIKQQKMLEGLINQELDDAEKNDIFGKTFVELADLTITVISNSIVSVTIPAEDDGKDTLIEDRETILEWLKTITKADYDVIKDRVEELSEGGIENLFNAQCQECNHTWQANVELDPVNFFGG